jgi:hypothetical protein
MDKEKRCTRTNNSDDDEGVDWAQLPTVALLHKTQNKKVP